MAYWNYRVFKKIYYSPEGDPIEELSLRETYYDNNNKVSAWSANPAPAISESGVNGLRDILLQMLEALDKPVLEDK